MTISSDRGVNPQPPSVPPPNPDPASVLPSQSWIPRRLSTGPTGAVQQAPGRSVALGTGQRRRGAPVRLESHHMEARWAPGLSQHAGALLLLQFLPGSSIVGSGTPIPFLEFPESVATALIRPVSWSRPPVRAPHREPGTPNPQAAAAPPRAHEMALQARAGPRPRGAPRPELELTEGPRGAEDSLTARLRAGRGLRRLGSRPLPFSGAALQCLLPDRRRLTAHRSPSRVPGWAAALGRRLPWGVRPSPAFPANEVQSSGLGSAAARPPGRGALGEWRPPAAPPRAHAPPAQGFASVPSAPELEAPQLGPCLPRPREGRL